MTGQTPSSSQLDLFLHSRGVVLANEAIDALLAREPAHSAHCLDRLRAEEPDHWALDALQCLCRTLGEWPLPSSSLGEIAEAVRRLENEVHPAALAALGHRAKEFVSPLWRDLADAARLYAYDAALPQSCSAGLYLRCDDPWAAARAAESIPGWSGNADALYWLAVARHRTDGLDACIPPLMKLALVAPQRLPRALAEIDDALLHRDWRAFHVTCHWLDWDDEGAGAWFPAWYLVEHPGMRISVSDEATLPATQAARTAIEISRLLALEKRGYNAGLISARKRLRDLDSQLFALYMAHRDVGHP